MVLAQLGARRGDARVEQRLEHPEPRDDRRGHGFDVLLRPVVQREERRERVHRAGRDEELDEIGSRIARDLAHASPWRFPWIPPAATPRHPPRHPLGTPVLFPDPGVVPNRGRGGTRPGP